MALNPFQKAAENVERIIREEITEPERRDQEQAKPERAERKSGDAR